MARLITNKPWIQAYLDYVSETESPTHYNTWCAISAIGSVLKRRVYTQWGFYKIFCNQYIVLVGPPGIGKGTAINPAVELIKKANLVNHLNDRITAERIIDKLATGFQTLLPITGGGFNPIMESSATIVSTELPVFLGSSDWMLPLLCEMWDRNEFDYETKTKGSHLVKNLCVSLLAGCVPEFIRKLNKDATSAVTGGFTSRCIFVYASDKSKQVAWPQMNGQQSQLEHNLLEDLKAMSMLQGEFTFTPEAQKLWERWYINQPKNQFESDVLMAFRARMKTHIIKTAMILTISEGDSLVINTHQLQNAITLVNEVAKQVDITFRAVGESTLAAATDRIMRYLELKGISSRAQILHDNWRHCTDEDLGRILVVLENIGFCSCETKGNKLIYKCLGLKANMKGTGTP